MLAYTRLLKYRLPMMRGEDVRAVQRRLKDLGHSPTSVDGVFGPATERAVRAFQKAKDVSPVDGIVGRVTWGALFGGTVAERDTRGAADPVQVLARELRALATSHSRFHGSISWQVDRRGVLIDGEVQRTRGEPATVRRVWRDFGPAISKAAGEFLVPAELIVATICTESRGNTAARREEPGFTSDTATPHRVSTGLMQTLISTASATLGKPDVTSAWLCVPENSIRAGTAYIRQQQPKTHYDPPVVACAYNAGGVYQQQGSANRWKMRQYPIGTGKHADRFVQWFGDAVEVFRELDEGGGEMPAVSFYRLLA